MAADEEELDEVKGVGAALCLAALEGDAHDVVEASAEVLDVCREALVELVVSGEAVQGDGHDHASGGEDDAVGACAGLVAGTGGDKGGLVDVAVYPIAILEVVVEEAVDDGLMGELCEEVAVVVVGGGDGEVGVGGPLGGEGVEGIGCVVGIPQGEVSMDGREQAIEGRERGLRRKRGGRRRWWGRRRTPPPGRSGRVRRGRCREGESRVEGLLLEEGVWKSGGGVWDGEEGVGGGAGAEAGPWLGGEEMEAGRCAGLEEGERVADF